MDPLLFSSLRTVAVVLAAGRSVRAGAGAPKQYRLLDGAPLVRRTVSALLACPGVDAVRVVIHPDDAGRYADAMAGLKNLMAPVMGGATRQESARLGLESLARNPPWAVLLHDGARPFPSPALVARCLDALARHEGAIPTLSATDALIATDTLGRSCSLSREGVVMAQTPQAFRYAAIRAAHACARGRALRDDAAVAFAAGLDAGLVVGDPDNLKITVPHDFVRAARNLAACSDFRAGTGFDVHRFAPDRPLVLCGVTIPHAMGLAGHSDADAPFHALTDALLGAIAAPDLGALFPSGDPAWAGASSDVFVRHALERVRARGGRLASADITIVCEHPRMAPHIEAMRVNAARVLGVDSSRVGLKATTTDRLGAIGRGEGLAAQATVMIALPFSDRVL